MLEMCPSQLILWALVNFIKAHYIILQIKISCVDSHSIIRMLNRIQKLKMRIVFRAAHV
jgi:hypothetical protein